MPYRRQLPAQRFKGDPVHAKKPPGLRMQGRAETMPVAFFG